MPSFVSNGQLTTPKLHSKKPDPLLLVTKPALLPSGRRMAAIRLSSNVGGEDTT